MLDLFLHFPDNRGDWGVGVSRFCRQVSTFYIYQATRASFKGHKNKKIATRKEEVCHTRLQNFTV